MSPFVPLTLLLAALLQGEGDEKINRNAPPEAVRRLIPPGAKLMGPPMSEGIIVYDDPIHSAPSIDASVPLVRDQIVAKATAVIRQESMDSAGPIRIRKPFNMTLPSASSFAAVLAGIGKLYCLKRPPGMAYSPPKDERGAIFPGVCLLDQNRDGLFEASIFLPYDQKESQPQKVAIHPIPLKPSPAIVCARAAAIYAHRRLRVTAITEVSVTFGIEDAISYEGLLTTGDYQPDYGPRLSLYLKAGEEGSIDGFALRVEGQNGAWRVTVKGAFTPWVTTEKAATIVKIGPQKLPPRWN